MDDFSVRPATSTDSAGVTSCVERAYTLYVERLGKKPGPMTNDYADIISNHRVFVVEQTDRIIGVLVLMKTDEGFLLDNIAVDPITQGSGVGGQLLTLAEREAKAEGYNSIYLYTHVKMLENIPYYEKRGYRVYERKVVDGYSRVYMRKSLCQSEQPPGIQ